MGRCIKELGYNRRELVISTKIFFGTGRKDPNQNGLSRKHIVEGLQDSLSRLQMTYVDIVFAHRFDVATPVEEVVRAFNYCIDQGYCFYWGTSEWTAAQIEAAIAVADRLGLVGPCVEQPHYSMLHRERFEVEYAELYEKVCNPALLNSFLAILTRSAFLPSVRLWNDDLESIGVRYLERSQFSFIATYLSSTIVSY